MARGPINDDDLSSMNSQELSALLAKIETAIVDKRKESRSQVKAQIIALATESGFTVEELFSTRSAKAPRGSAPVKYRNPDNPDETWSGRGRMARWIVEKLKKRGTKLEDFAV